MTVYWLCKMQATRLSQGAPAMEMASLFALHTIIGHECRHRCRPTCAPLHSTGVIGRRLITSDTGHRRQHEQQP